MVVELGCGSLGGFVPALWADGYGAVGIDPAAPEGPDYRRVEFERVDLPAHVDVVVASTSLHHVADVGVALDKVAGALPDPDGWLRRRLEDWADSGEPWESCFQGWAVGHGLHRAAAVMAELDRRFERVHFGRGPYLFTELAQTTEADERRAIDAGEIRALRIDYVGRRPGAVEGVARAHL